MWASLVLLLAELAGYLHERARNYRLITLVKLYENLDTTRRGIADLVGGGRAPNESELQLSVAKFKDLQKLAAEFGSSQEIYSSDGDGDRDGDGVGRDVGTDPEPVS